MKWCLKQTPTNTQLYTPDSQMLQTLTHIIFCNRFMKNTDVSLGIIISFRPVSMVIVVEHLFESIWHHQEDWGTNVEQSAAHWRSCCFSSASIVVKKSIWQHITTKVGGEKQHNKRNTHVMPKSVRNTWDFQTFAIASIASFPSPASGPHGILPMAEQQGLQNKCEPQSTGPWELGMPSDPASIALPRWTWIEGGWAYVFGNPIFLGRASPPKRSSGRFQKGPATSH